MTHDRCCSASDQSPSADETERRQGVVAFIPAKGSSRRVPGKNLRILGGQPLIARKIRALQRVRQVERVVVGSDSEPILELAQSLGATALLRDAYHCDEARCPANDMIVDMVSRIEAEIVLWAHCTNPFISVSTFDRAVDAFFQAQSEGHDSLMSVGRLSGHFWLGESKPLNFQPLQAPHPLAAALPPLFAQDGAIFIQPKTQMLQNRYFYGARVKFFEVDPAEGMDINTELDFDIATALISTGRVPD